MTITERAAYLKGLAEGIDIDKETKEGKLSTAIIDLLGEMADELTATEEDVAELDDGLDAISEDLSDIEEIVFGGEDDEYDEYDEYDDECGDDCCCGHHHHHDDEDFEVSVECPACDTEFIIGEDDLNKGSVECPNCGEKLEFEFNEDEEDKESEDDED